MDTRNNRGIAPSCIHCKLVDTIARRTELQSRICICEGRQPAAQSSDTLCCSPNATTQILAPVGRSRQQDE